MKMYNSELYHYGIKGMKWGIRRNRKPKISEDDYHDDYKKAHRKDAVQTMSDSDLRSRINRLQMETQYSKLSKENYSRGKEHLNTIFKAGTTIAAITTTALTIYGNSERIGKIIKKHGSRN